MKLFVSPHNDDEVLFGAFTLMTERPYVVIVYDSYVQHERGLKGCDWSSRRRETIAACAVLGIPSAHVFFLGFPDSKVDTPEAIANRLAALPVLTGFGTSEFETVYAPMGYAPKGNQHHNKVNLACQLTFQTSGQLKYYHTYKAEGKVTSGVRVPVPAEIQGITPAVELKLRALLKYKSQLGLWSTQDHFLREQYEYMEA